MQYRHATFCFDSPLFPYACCLQFLQRLSFDEPLYPSPGRHIARDLLESGRIIVPLLRDSEALRCAQLKSGTTPLPSCY